MSPLGEHRTTTTKPRGSSWHPDMFVHRDTEIETSKHEACGSPVRHQSLASVPAVVTDETAMATAVSYADVDYCPKCDVRVELKIMLYVKAKR